MGLISTMADILEHNAEKFDELKEELLQALHHEEARDWTFLLFCLVFVVLFAAIIALRKVVLGWVDNQVKKTDNQVDDFVVDMVQKWTQPYVAGIFSFFVASQTYHVSNVIDTVAKASFLGILTWRVIRSFELGSNFVMDQWVFKNTEEGKNLSANFHKGLRLCLYTGGAIFILDNVGMNISSIVAGLGIGGTGIVEHIGFKTTRIRALSGEIIVFPNSTISGSTLQNFSRADHINQSITIGVAVDTSDEMVRKIPSIFMGALENQAGFSVGEVYFKEFGEFSLNFEIRFSVKSNNPSDIRAANGEVNTIINETCKKNSIEMPFRTEVIINKNGDTA